MIIEIRVNRRQRWKNPDEAGFFGNSGRRNLPATWFTDQTAQRNLLNNPAPDQVRSHPECCILWVLAPRISSGHVMKIACLQILLFLLVWPLSAVAQNAPQRAAHQHHEFDRLVLSEEFLAKVRRSAT